MNAYPKNRKPHNGDAFFDINTDATVIFHVDPNTGNVTITHEFGHTRVWSHTFMPGTDLTKDWVIFSAPLDKTGIYTIEVDSTSKDGASYEMRLVVSGAGKCFLIPVASNAHNTKLDRFAIGETASKVELTMKSKTDSGMATVYMMSVQSNTEDMSLLELMETPTLADSVVLSDGIIDATVNFPITIGHDVRSYQEKTKGALVSNLLVVTQAEYDASDKNPQTLYYIPE